MAAIPASRDLGTFVRRRMEDVGMIKADLAETLGWSERTLQRLLNGQRPLYDDGEVVRLARYLEVHERDLWAFLVPPDDAEEITLEQLVAEIRAVGAKLDELYRRWGPPEATAPASAPALAEEEEPQPASRRHPSGRAESRRQRASGRDQSEDRDSSQRGA